MIVDLAFSGGAEFCDPPDREQLSGLHQIRAQYRSEWGPKWVPAGQEVSDVCPGQHGCYSEALGHI